MCSDENVSAIHALARRVSSAGTARFRFSDSVPSLGAEPLDTYEGALDARRGNYIADDRCVVDGLLYARSEGGVWTRMELGQREPIGPTWLLALLGGVKSVVSGQPEDASGPDRPVIALADLSEATRATGRRLDSVGGGGRRAGRDIRVSVHVGTDGLPMRVLAEVADHLFACRYWDYGAEVTIRAPSEATELPKVSTAGFLMTAARRAARRRGARPDG
jgi:hypothetical protein